MEEEAISQLNNMLLLELDPNLRFIIEQRIQQALRNRSLHNFRCTSMTEAAIIQPLSLYDLLKRLIVWAEDPLSQFGEVIGYLCEILENFRIETKLRSHTTAQTSEDMENFIVQLASEVVSSQLDEQLLLTYNDFAETAMKTFPPPDGMLQENMAAPTQSDIEALREEFSEIKSHHGRAAVIGRFLRECGEQAEDIIMSGGTYDIDFTVLPNELFWCLANICKRYAPKIKLME